MLPDRKRQVRVRANFAGDVELRVKPGDRVERGTALVVVEGEEQIETLSARGDAVVLSVHVEDEDEVAAAALLVVLQED
jgi:acetyl/propionyl-CoA carboxylase alpha subunit